MLSDALGRLAAGERRAFAEVYTTIWPLVRSFAGRALAERADAEDVAQSALLKIFSRASEYDPERDAVAWILGVVAWEIRTFRKRCQRRRQRPLPRLLLTSRQPLRNTPVPLPASYVVRPRRSTPHPG